MALFDPIELAATVISAFVSHNAVTRSELPALFEGLHATLKKLGEGGEVAPAVETATRIPAVSIRKSVTPDYLICLDDGHKFKSLRRHLAALGMTPEQYRAKWSLPFDYPMVAPNYAAHRSELAKKTGLGRKPVAVPAVSVETIKAVAPEPTSAPKRKARSKSEAATTAPAVTVKRKPRPLRDAKA